MARITCSVAMRGALSTSRLFVLRLPSTSVVGADMKAALSRFHLSVSSASMGPRLGSLGFLSATTSGGDALLHVQLLSMLKSSGRVGELTFGEGELTVECVC
eukprot:6479037-Amphidinium_carterae.1